MNSKQIEYELKTPEKALDDLAYQLRLTSSIARIYRDFANEVMLNDVEAVQAVIDSVTLLSEQIDRLSATADIQSGFSMGFDFDYIPTIRR